MNKNRRYPDGQNRERQSAYSEGKRPARPSSQAPRCPGTDGVRKAGDFARPSRKLDYSSQNIQKEGSFSHSSGVLRRFGDFFTPKMTMYFAIGGVLLALVICMIINIAIGVRSIEVNGADMSSAQEITEIAGIKEGSGYFSYNTAKSEENVLRLIPCIEEINIRRSVFGKVSIDVVEKNAYWYTSLFGEYFVLSDELEVIRKTETKKELISRGLVRIDFPEVKSAILGKTLEFTDDGRDCSFIFDFLSEIRESKLYKSGRLNQICIETKFEIFIVSDLKYKINVGRYSNVKLKLDRVETMLANEIFDNDQTWEINFVESKDEIAPRQDPELNFDYLRP